MPTHCTDNYRQLFLDDAPLLDVRAPVEFNQGAFPTSQNIPLLDDDQRQQVGTCYKNHGQDAAIELGWKLAPEHIQQHRITAWKAHIEKHPEGYLYCFRGGLRSRLSQQLLKQSSVDYPLITGGYKAMRRYLIDSLEEKTTTLPMMLICGRTGSGKTLVVNQAKHAIDLEGLAHHRGSAFGGQTLPQPTQIAFENSLSIAVLKHHVQSTSHLFLEDEGKLIGKVCLPINFLTKMRQSPFILLETPIEERIKIVLKDYVTDALPTYLSQFGDSQGWLNFRQHILGNLERIRKRLGGKRYQSLFQSFSQALDESERTSQFDAFRPGIEILLTDYYDPMYDYQQSLREGKACFQGGQLEMNEWIATQCK
jgi:tRNA 2-selenouridine synthase